MTSGRLNRRGIRSEKERESSASRRETVAAWWSGEAEDRVKGDMRGERDVIRFVAILQQAPLKGISHRHAAPAVMTWKQPEAPHSSPPASTHPCSGLLQNLSTTERLSGVKPTCVQSNNVHIKHLQGLRTSPRQYYTYQYIVLTISIGILLILLGLILLVAWNKPKQLHVYLFLEFWYTDRSNVAIERTL